MSGTDVWPVMVRFLVGGGERPLPWEGDSLEAPAALCAGGSPLPEAGGGSQEVPLVE